MVSSSSSALRPKGALRSRYSARPSARLRSCHSARPWARLRSCHSARPSARLGSFELDAACSPHHFQTCTLGHRAVLTSGRGQESSGSRRLVVTTWHGLHIDPTIEVLTLVEKPAPDANRRNI